MLALCKAEKRGETSRRAAGEQANTVRGEVVQLGEHASNGTENERGPQRPALPAPGFPGGEGKGARGRAITLPHSLWGFCQWLLSLAYLGASMKARFHVHFNSAGRKCSFCHCCQVKLHCSCYFQMPQIWKLPSFHASGWGNSPTASWRPQIPAT